MPAILQRRVSLKAGPVVRACGKMSTDKENAENGAMEVEETLDETLDTKPTTDVEVSEESQVKKDAKKKIKGKDVKKESKSSKPKENKIGKLKNEDSESEELEEEEEEEEEEENDENDENEKSGDDKVPLLDQPLELSGTRERKKVQRFSAEYKTEPKDIGPIDIPEGQGTQLGNIPRIEANLQKSKTEALKPLHKILFIRVGKSKLLKKNIRKFNGFDFDEQSEQYAKKKQAMLKYENKILREICSILDLKKPNKRDELVDTILSFLMKPEDLKPMSKPRPKRAARSNHKSYSESDDDDDEKERKSSRRGKKKRVSLKEVSSDEEENEDFENDENEKDEEKEDEKDEENLIDAVKSKEKKDSKGNDSDKDSKENETDEDDDEDKDEGSSDYSEDEKTKSKKKSRSVKNNKKQSAKKTNSKKPISKKSDKKPPIKKRDKSDEESSEDEPLAKKSKAPPTDEEIKSYVKEILEGANLEETTMKIVCKQVYAHYPDFDLAHKKDFIKTTVKSLIST